MDNILDTKNPMGRPPKFTEKTREKIYLLLDTPIPLTTICRMVHITLQTLQNWRKVGYDIEDALTNGTMVESDLTDIDKEFLEFSRKFDEIEGSLESRIVGDVYEKYDGKKFILSKRFSSWKDKTTVEHSGKVDVALSWKDLVSGDNE